MSTANDDFHRRRAIAEQRIKDQGLMAQYDDVAFGATRMALYERLVNENMPAADEVYEYEPPPRYRDPEPTPAQIAAAVGRPVRLSDPVERLEGIARGIELDGIAERQRRGEAGGER